jgi:hypothetical protein
MAHLHACARVDLELDRLDGRAEAGVVLPRVLALAVPLRVVDVLDGEVAAEALLRDLELGGRVPVREEAERHAEVQDRLQRQLLERGDVDRLGVVPEPVAKVDAFDVEAAELALADQRAEGEAAFLRDVCEGVFLQM